VPKIVRFGGSLT